ncbi:hypothetical protein LTR49_028641, partial [Elasticomyces elasticus]
EDQTGVDKRTTIGESLIDRLQTVSLQLVRSQRSPAPPSIIDNTDTLFAILHVIEHDVWVTAGLSGFLGHIHLKEEVYFHYSEAHIRSKLYPKIASWPLPGGFTNVYTVSAMGSHASISCMRSPAENV